ncbi:MAG: hypothetical protein NC489_20890 [Ruminococcus flavefaciens]|nr:hypothetical protein [Ruminococcus flavefaciens]
MKPEYLILILLSIVAAVIAGFALLDILYVKRIHDMHRGVHEELNRRANMYRDGAILADTAAKMFATILIDLSHTNCRESLCWKLSTIRSVEHIMMASGYMDRDLYQYMCDNLYHGDYDTRVTWIDKMEAAVKGYYIMDPEVGNNICDVLRLLARMSMGYDATVKTYGESKAVLLKLIDTLNLSFVMYDEHAEEARKKTRSGASFDEMLKALEDLSDSVDPQLGKAPPTPAVIVTEGDDTVAQGYQEEEEPAESSDIEVHEGGDPEVHGEEIHAEEAPGPDPKNVTQPSVIVVDRSRVKIEYQNKGDEEDV